MADTKTPVLTSADIDHAKTVTSTGKAVKRRITSIDTARSLFTRAKNEFVYDFSRHARLKNMNDGAPPFLQTRLDELALGNMCNVNFLEMTSILNQKAAQWYEVFYEVPTLVQFSRAPGTPLAFDEYARVLDEEFTRLNMEWSGFLPFMDKARRESDLYGFGVGVFADKWDWRPKAFNCGSLIFDPYAKIDIETMEYFFLVDDDVTAGQLFRQVFDSEEAARKEGWNIDRVKALLMSIYVDGAQQSQEGLVYSASAWEDLQQQIRNGTSNSEVKDFQRVRLVHLYVREIKSGKLSHYIMPDSTLADKDDFLYKSEDSVDAVHNVLWVLPYNNGDGYLKSVRGLASEIETHCDLSNRYLGRVYDAGFMSASLILQPGTPGDYANMQMIRAGVMTILPPGLNVIQKSTMAPQVADLIPLRDLSLSIMRNNTGVWRQHPEIFSERESQKTARQVAEESAKEARFEKAAVQYDYGYLEALYREQWRRLTSPQYLQAATNKPGLKEAREFIRRLVLRGIPEEVIPRLHEAFVPGITKAIGMGSWGLKLDLTNQLVQASAGWDEHGRRNAMRDWLGVRVGYRNVDRYVAPVDRDTIPTDESSHAVLENNDIREGAKVLAASDQWHVTHIQVHAPVVVEIIQAVEANQVQDPRAALPVLISAVEHVSEHLKFIVNDPTRADIVAAATEVVKRGVAAIKTLTAAAEQQMRLEAKAAQQRQGVVDEAQAALQSREQELEALKIQKDAENERLKQESLNQMRADKTREQMGIRRAESQEGMRIRAEEHDQRMQQARDEAARKATQQ